MRTIHGKLALVTGAAAGIGRALAIELARQGTHLVLVDVDAVGLADAAAVARMHGVHVDACLADLSRAAEVSRVAKLVKDRHGALDILVNNAGVAYYGTSHEMSEDQWRKVMAVNLLAPMQLTLELLPCLFVPAEAHVLNMCSLAGLVGVSRLAAYNTSKFALVGFSESLRAEYGPRGIGVTALCPAIVRTDIFKSAMTGGDKKVPKLPGWLTVSPERIARRAVRAIRKDQGLVVVTAPAQFLWLVKRLFPGILCQLQRFRFPRPKRPAPAAILKFEPVTESLDEPTRRAA